MKNYLIIALLLTVLTGCLFAQAKDNPFQSSGEIFEESEGEKGPSRLAAAGLSFLLPGAGEMYLGDKRGAALFFSAEGAIWGTFAGFNIYGGWRKQEYRNFGAIHAGLDPEGKDDQFFEDVLYYQSRDDYNYWIHLVYRDEYPLYPETEEYFWEWQSDEVWDEYADIRSSSEVAYRRARTMLGVALINRVISVVHVLRMDIDSKEDPQIMPSAFIFSSPDGKTSIGLGVTGSF